MFANPEARDRLQGSIEEGKDADFVIWDPEAVYTITEDMIHFKHKVSAGYKCKGFKDVQNWSIEPDPIRNCLDYKDVQKRFDHTSTRFSSAQLIRGRPRRVVQTLAQVSNAKPIRRSKIGHLHPDSAFKHSL
jgi:urease alpha subunit